MASKKGRRKKVTTKIGRDAKTGEFIPVAKARKRKSTAVVETIKRRTRGKGKK